MYNINTNFIEFNGIIQAITKFVKNTKNTVINKRLQNPLLPTYLKIYLKSNKRTFIIYSSIIKQNQLQYQDGNKSIIFQKKLGKIYSCHLLKINIIVRHFNGFKQE